MNDKTDDLIKNTNGNMEMNTVEQTQSANGNITDQSMEDLKMDDNDGKDTSIEEDILGAESLLMSDSEGEETTEIKELIVITNELQSEKENISQMPTKLGQQANEHATDYEISGTFATEQNTKKSILKLVDSESENEERTYTVNKSKAIRQILDSDEERQEAADDRSKAISQKKFSNLIDSDSEPDERSSIPTKKFYNFSDSDDDSYAKTKTQKKAKRNLKKNASDECETTSDESDASDTKRRKYQPKPKKPYDDDDSKGSAHSGSGEDGLKEQSDDPNSQHRDKKIRASAKKAMDEMQAIQSEQQRLHREAHISIPYHKPKKHTLDEFLKRRTIIKPSLDETDTCSPISMKLQSKNLKMTSEELEEYAKLMEERAKEATEFFKSESESEEEIMKDNVGVLDVSTAEEAVPAEKAETIQASDAKDSVDLELSNHEEIAANNEADMPATITDDKSPFNAIVTEVIELPKIDLSSVQISLDPCNAPVDLPACSTQTQCAATASNSNTPSAAVKIQNLKKMLIEENKNHVSPVIRGDKNMVIDLESGDLVAKTPTGVDNLLERLMASKKARKERLPDSVSILSLEQGKLEMSKVHISHHDETEVVKEQKPGAAYLKLKNDLKSIITKKRLEDIERKKAQEQERNKIMQGDEDDAEMELDDEEFEPDTKPTRQKEIIIDEEENAIEINEDEENSVTDVVDDEVIDADDDNMPKESVYDAAGDEENDDDEEESSDSEYEEAATNHADDEKRRNRIIKAFQDDSDEDVDDLNLLNSIKMPPPKEPSAIPGHSALFDIEEKKSAIEEENELMDLCSGKFGMTQHETPMISQIPKTQLPTQPGANEEELMALCSGTFDGTQIKDGSIAQNTQIAPKGNKILSSDEETDEKQLQHQDQAKERIKKLTKRMKKRTTRLGFSDDEDEDEGEEVVIDAPQLASEDEDVVDQQDEEEPEAFVDYDSEENEIIVKMTKKDRRERAQNFVENEAELSESEWGSADEDEKNLDNYDIELGDEDEFDREKLRTELGQIHVRKMLDEDVKEVRKLQEMFFEDEENDGIGRQRQFRWKNVEHGFSLDDARRRDDNNGGEPGDSGDEENEHLWRKIRFEREQLLKQQMQKEKFSGVSKIINSTLGNPTACSTLGATKKLNIITPKLSTTKEATKVTSPFLISKSISSVHSKSVRASFLVRDKETLTKLVGLTKSKVTTTFAGLGSEAEEAAGTVSTKMASSKNFVFATLTEEEHESLKRKADDLMNSSNEYGINYMKKPKKEPRRDKCLIDQLL